MAGDQGERAGRLGLDVHPVAGKRRGEPLARRFLVHVAGFQREDVQLGPGQLREPLELLGPEGHGPALEVQVKIAAID